MNEIKPYTPARQGRKKHVLDKTTPKKNVHKRLVITDDGINTSTRTMTEEIVLTKLSTLSPLTTNSFQNSNSPASCRNVSSLQRLRISSPKQDKKFIKIVNSKRVFNDDDYINGITPLDACDKENYESKNHMSSFVSPTKKSKYQRCKISERKSNQVSPSTQSSLCNTSNSCDSVEPSPDSFDSLQSALHHSLPGNLIGRKNEQTEITEFICSHIKTQTSASMYISGAPGTGKTACLTKILTSSKISQNVKTVVINCMAFRTAQKIYQRVASEIGTLSKAIKSFRNASEYIEEKIVEDGPMILMVLDEMDQLDCKNQEVLYMMFSWTNVKNSRLILIGIANSLNLTDRMLPRLQAKAKLRPKLINFKPYAREELLQILQARIQACKVSEASETVIDHSALQFCARKVAATSGDARKALDICRRAVEIVETNKTCLKSRTESKPTPQKVGLMQISRVISEACDSANMCVETENCDADDCFPLQQKLLVCTLIMLCKNIKCKETSLGKLYESYTKVCKKRQVPSVSQSEFHSLSDLVESRGIITIKKAKQLRQSQVKLNIQENDVEYALKGKALLSSILKESL